MTAPHSRKLWPLWALALGLACATSGAPGKDNHDAPLANEATPARTRANPPAAVDRALLPPVAVESPMTRPAEARFDVNVRDVPARDFFMSLVADTPYNMTLSPELRGKITLALQGVTVEQALEVVCQAYNFEYERSAGGFVVQPSGLRTRIFQVDYINLHRVGESETRITRGDLESGSQPNNYTQNDSGASDSGSGDEGQSESRIKTSSDTNMWQELATSVRSLVGSEGGRSVVVSPNTGLLIVRAQPRELQAVDDYLKIAETNISRLVILEAKILEVTLNDGFQTGINWAQLSTYKGGNLVLGQVGGGSAIENGISEIAGKQLELGPRLSDLAAGTATSAFGGVFTAALQADKFSMFVELLQSQGDVRTLSNPRISTVNNQKAVIKVGSDEFFVTDVSTTTVTGTATTSTPNITLTPFFSGIVLDVTPQISEDDDVILHVHPSVTQVEDQTKTITLDGREQQLPLAFSRVRESDAIVRAHSGQVVVIGGLMRDASNDEHAGIPFVKDIPWLGKLFQHMRLRSRKSELVILLRPIVVRSDGWSPTIRETARRYENLMDQRSGKEASEIDEWLRANDAEGF